MSTNYTTLRKEALSLYREILRVTKTFTWQHPSGLTWGEVLKTSARKEFEEAKFERDAETIVRMLVTGRQALMIIQEKLQRKGNTQLCQFTEKQCKLDAEFEKEIRRRTDSSK
eukprot:jgi/Galph1/599/GphlegSOOS_G5391.1